MTARQVSYPFGLTVAILAICGCVFLALFGWQVYAYGPEKGGFISFIEVVTVWALAKLVAGGCK